MRSMCCLPFSAELYRDLQMHGLDAAAIWNKRSRYAKTERWPRSAEALEDDLRWLITVGVLRREVDGQGLTSPNRLVSPCPSTSRRSTPTLISQRRSSSRASLLRNQRVLRA